MQSMIDHSTVATFKCRKCRHFLFSEEQISNCHNKPVFPVTDDDLSCSPKSNVWYLREESIPDWLKDQVDEGNWMKGKLFCPHCKSRVGSFDFVSGSKCTCGSNVLPSLHVVSCKLDYTGKIPSPVTETNATSVEC